MTRHRKTGPLPPPAQPVPEIPEDSDEGDVDEEVAECLKNVSGALKSTDVVVLREVLKIAQAMIISLQDQRDEAREESAEYEAQLVSIHAYRRRARMLTNQTKVQHDLDNDINAMIPEKVKLVGDALDMEQRKAAYVWIFFWCFSTPPSLLKTPRPEFEWDDVGVRYASPENEIAALTAELYAALPTSLHKHVQFQDEAFKKLFKVSCDSLRSNTVKRLRGCSSVIYTSIAPLFDSQRAKLKAAGEWPNTAAEQGPLTYSQTLFERLYDRSKVPVFETLLGFNANKNVSKGKEGKRYARWAPILYLDPVKPVTSGLFRNPVLLKIGCVMMYGPSAVSGDPALCKFDTRNPLDKIDLLTTPGPYLSLCPPGLFLSPLHRTSIHTNCSNGDITFPNYTLGGNTKINYLGDFNAYKKYLITYWDTSGVKSLVNYWNSQLFPHHAKVRRTLAGSAQGNHGDEPTGTSRAMQSDSESEPEPFEAPMDGSDERPESPELEEWAEELLAETSAFINPSGSSDFEEEFDDEFPPNNGPTATPRSEDPGTSTGSAVHHTLPAIQIPARKDNTALLIAAASPRRHKTPGIDKAPIPLLGFQPGIILPGLRDTRSPSIATARSLPSVPKGKGKQIVIGDDDDIDISGADGSNSPSTPSFTAAPKSDTPPVKKKKKTFRQVVHTIEVEETDDEDGHDDNIHHPPPPQQPKTLMPALRSLESQKTRPSSGTRTDSTDATGPDISTSRASSTRPKPRPVGAGKKALATQVQEPVAEAEVEDLAGGIQAVELAPRAKKTKAKATAQATRKSPRT
ncbi:hypothetical protein BKA70DRAFT_1453447 [Coprinopsis sp. MPI-PUGE-AT-0042]|nr:hypothetical protein BKA70DRAFT_1453447 [Coprinopsis sp. MPI-PUGE-AT-0042]